MLLMSILYSIPLFLDNVVIHNADQDTLFHLSRIIGLSNVWESPVNFNTFHHHGTMMNNFYPWITLYPAFILFKITNSLTLSYQIYYFLITLLTMLIAYYSMNTLKKGPLSSIIFALIYSFAAYRSTDIFQRASLGEAVALTFLPLILAGCIAVFSGNHRYWILITIGMSFVLYSHLLSVAMIAVFMGIAFLLTFPFWNNKKKRITALVYATISTLLLSGGFLVPFIQQSFAQTLKVPNPGTLIGTPPSDMLGKILNNDLSGYTIGLVLFLSVFFTLSRFKYLNKTDKFIYYFGLSVLVLSTSLFPWDFLQNTPFASIQFVWRLSTFSTLFIAYSASAVFDQSNVPASLTLKNISIYILFLIGLVALHQYSINNLYNSGKDSQLQLTEDIIVEKASSYLHTDYANKDSILYPEVIQNHLYFLNDEVIEPTYSYTDSIFTIVINNPNITEGRFITPIYRYLGQDIKLNGQDASSTLSRFGTTELIVPPGESTVEITYHYTALAIFSKIANGIFAAIFLVYLHLTKNKRRFAVI
jgi:hypothetical protein